MSRSSNSNPVEMDEAEALEMAAELLAANSDSELNNFLSGLMRRATRRLGRAMPRPVAQNLGALLKGAARKILPHVGRALNLQNPRTGIDLTGSIAAAGQLLGLEMEGLSPEDQELTAARQLVQLADSAASNAARSSSGSSPSAAASRALAAAAAVHAPGLVRAKIPSGGAHGKGGGCGCGGHGTCKCHEKTEGHWVRSKGKIILQGV